MKYIQLTKEQLEALHKEFALFLASQQITQQEWQNIKENSPELAQDEINVFSDYVWDNVLEKVKYIEKIDMNSLFLFSFEQDIMRMILVKVINDKCNFREENILKYISENLLSDDIQIFTSSKKYSEDKKKDIFEIILQGGEISDGKLYQSLYNMLKITE